MSGAFGLDGVPQLIPFPVGRVLENHGRVDAWDRDGGSHRPPSASDVWRVNSEIELAWDENLPGLRRPFWLCPKCGRRCRHIYTDYMACRICSKLDYACRHRHRSIPGYNRILYLRRKLGVDPAPFSPLPFLPPQATRKRKLAAEIRALETGLIEHLRRDINDVLERRIKLRGLK